MSRPSRNNAVPVALFPFLAVLLCTMGALVVVMIALSRAGAENARRAAAKRPTPAVDVNAQKLAEIQTFQAEVSKAQQQVDAKLKAEVERLSAIEASIRRQQEKLEKLKLAVQELVLMGEEHYDDREQAERELARLQQLIVAGEKSLEDLQSQQANSKQSFAILPHVGAGGTRRRPLYFECVGNKVILQPEGIELVEEDFLPPWGLGSPLAVAIRTATEYYRRRPQSVSDAEGAPYPLIIVRPSGVELHSAALAVLNSYEGDFGYQAAPEDWKLAYPNANPELASRVQNAINIARQRREALAQAAPMAFGPGFGSGGSGGAPGGAEGPGLSGDYTTGALSGDGNPTADPEDRFFTEELNTGAQQVNSGNGSGQGGAAASGAQGFSVPYRSNNPSLGSTAENPYAGLAAATSAADARNSKGNPAGAAGGLESQGSADGTSATGSTSAKSGAAQQSQTAQATAGGSGGAEGNLSMPSPTDAQQQMSASSQAKSKNAQADAAAAKRAESVWEPKRPDDVAVRRRVQVIVRGEQLAILSDETPPSGIAYWTANSQTVVLDQPTAAHVPAFIDEMRKHVTGWGFAGDGLFWRPVVYLNVAPGGEQRAQELAALLKNSGLEMQIATPMNLPQTASETGGTYAPR
jgi:hypothetical protein